ncbi:hypothetical protein L6164_022751 [Bauhinia variegata]|uniref:Uncharacterized protein n=1 Tax=Bauhinia variegata TaxID=167791 RepID=A0ACB9MGJ3_BAUVA|nr:hypothetical protein L6164_022751 [Bauhinia variegata]
MLEPRQSDIPALILVLVVFPLVAYILLGKWSEASKKRDRITLLAQLAADEALRAEEMAVPDVIPPVSSSKSEIHVCARCSAPARTRCSKCKSVRYCSGNCQIIHWRQVHKHECQPLEPDKPSSFPLAVSFEEYSHDSGLFYENKYSPLFSDNLNQTIKGGEAMDNVVHPLIGTDASTVDHAFPNNSHVPILERRTSHKSNREAWRRDNGTMHDSSVESSGYQATLSPSSSVVSKEAFMRQKSRNNDYAELEEEISKKANGSGPSVPIYQEDASAGPKSMSDNYQSQLGNGFIARSNFGCSSLPNAANNFEVVDEFEKDISTKGGKITMGEIGLSEEAAEPLCSSEMTTKGGIKAKKISRPPKTRCSKMPKSKLMVSGDLCCPEIEKKGQIAGAKIAGIRDALPSQGSTGSASIEIMKTMGLRKSGKLTTLATSEVSGDKCKKIKMLFPYDDFVKLFHSEVFGICPRGLLNCGNSCYANAVLQCLTCTKPLVVYLLCRSHSKTCCAKDWCLMCELEQHILRLQENGGPLSPSRILWHMQSINCQMGDGNQEDAHEFLRLLIASMQSICLEGLGGEKKVEPRLQETTFVQHTFGGRLRSKVKCLKCNHESERYENIMDLTLEILGWVESLEDALTQFTSPEDLDGENMYRCGRCTAYVRARKQLSIHEAPNILTIVLKRFQEGRYGKINKCITFPDMLDMIPFMTGAGDVPPLYLLYAVVVHLDTQNASFSGHYVSYVKDMQGRWFRIDDTEVQPVPMSQVMSEGAYILFYMRSCPRPQAALTGKTKQQQVPDSSKCYPVEARNPSRSGHSRHGSQFVGSEPSPEAKPEMPTSHGVLRRSANRNVLPVTETYAENFRDFPDAASSDWSLFTSSDEASFTTESTRDSFSTVDYSDSCNMDPLSSIFGYAPENSRIAARYAKFSNSRPLTRFFPNSSLSSHPLERVQIMDQSRWVRSSSVDPSSNGNHGMYVNYESNPVYGF